MSDPKLVIVVASTRPGRVGPQVADWIAGRARAHGGFAVEVADLAAIGLPLLDEPHHPSQRAYTSDHARAWSATVDAADAFLFVMPEYNYGFCAPLKNAIDYLYHEWADKPVGFVSYGMTSGGLRAVQMIKQVVTTLRMLPVTDAVTVFLKQRLDEHGHLHPDEAMEVSARAMLHELARLAPVFAALRSPPGVTT